MNNINSDPLQGLGDASAGGESVDNLVEMGGAAFLERADTIAKNRGFDSAQAAIDVFEKTATREQKVTINQRLDALDEPFFVDLCDRAQGAVRADREEAVAKSGGCQTQSEFIEVCEKRSRAVHMGESTGEFDAKIVATPEHIAQGHSG